MANLWENDDPVSDLGIDVPPWIEEKITPYDVAAVNQGGCASGAYMPAVTYWQALETMGDYGDNVLDFIQEALGEVPMPDSDESWSAMACHFLATAVELWCGGVEDEVHKALDKLEDEDDEDEDDEEWEDDEEDKGEGVE